MATLFGNDAHLTDMHLGHRDLVGSVDTWTLPLCWHADVAERMGEQAASDDEPWWLAVDHGAIETDEVHTTADRGAVTCSGCREWMSA